MPPSAERRGPGRPPRTDDHGVATRERLLAAAVEACVAHGYEGATVSDIARRADVSAPAVYHHFGGKEELLVEAGRWSLERIGAGTDRPLDAAATVRAFLREGFADTRRLLAELHLAGQRRPEVADLLAKWHGEQAAVWAELSSRRTGQGAAADVATFFALLLGLCQIESLRSLGVPIDDVADRAASLTRSLFPDRPEEGSR